MKRTQFEIIKNKLIKTKNKNNIASLIGNSIDCESSFFI